MNHPPTTLTVAVFDRVVCVKIKGRADFTSSLDLKKLITELRNRGYERFIFELCECLMMDSTFLGVLSGLGLKITGVDAAKEKVNGASLELFNPSQRILGDLESLGVAHLFRVRQATDVPQANFKPVAHDSETTQIDITRNCLEAHRLLMSIQPENVGKFKDVTEFLANDLKRLESKPAPEKN